MLIPSNAVTLRSIVIAKYITSAKAKHTSSIPVQCVGSVPGPPLIIAAAAVGVGTHWFLPLQTEGQCCARN